jgi:hypothetical protein
VIERATSAGSGVDSPLMRFEQLRALGPQHYREVADAFVTLTPEYFLSRFGARYLETVFWPTFHDAPECFGFVWVDGGRVAGFAAGTTQRSRFIRQVISRAPFRFVLRFALAALRRPRLVADAAGLLWRLRQERSTGGPEAELISLGVVRAGLRPLSTGDGRTISPALVLVAAAAQRFRADGAATFRLYTGARNHLACAFYRRVGFREAHRLSLFGEEKICFIGDATAAAAWI